jgi:TRAP-type transport system periplasmic protein
MRMLFKLFFLAGTLFLAGTALGQTTPMAVRVGNSTANDAQEAINLYFATKLTEYSAGRIKASSHPGAALGSNPQMLVTLQAGALHAMVIPAGFMASVVPELSLFDMPFLLPPDPAKATAFAAQSKAVVKMKEVAAQKGIIVLSFYGVGSQNLLTRFPVSKLADLQGKLFRVIPSPPRIGTYKDWGAVPRPMPLHEVYTALQQGIVDGIENPPDVIYRMKLHEVSKYLTLTGHSTFVNALIVSKKWFDALPNDLKDVVRKTGRETIVFADVANTKGQKEGLEALKKAITTTSMPDAELQKMKDAVYKGIWEQMKNDPQKGSIFKLLAEDVARFSKK